MVDDAAGTDDNDDGERRASTPDPDATDSIDDRRDADDRGSWNQTDRRDRADDTDADDGFGAPSRDGGDEYRVPLDLTGDDAAANEDDADGDDPYGPEPSSTPIEPGDPDLESVVFVFLGAIAMTLVLLRVMTLPL